MPYCPPLPLTEEVRTRMMQELMPGESIIWADKPRAVLTADERIRLSYAIPILLMAGMPMPHADIRLACLSRLFLLLLGIVTGFAALQRRVGRAKAVCVFTTHRAFSVYPRFFRSPKVESYGLKRLDTLKLRVRPDAYGDLIFGYERTLNGRIFMPRGFMNIADAEAVYALMRPHIERAVRPQTGYLPTPKQAVKTELTEPQQRILDAVLEPGEELCFAEAAENTLPRGELFTLLCSALLCAAALTAALLLYRAAEGHLSAAVLPLLPVPFLLLFCLSSWREIRRTPGRFYAITTRRALCLHPTAGIEDAFPLHENMMQEHACRPDGSGRVVLGYTQERFHLRITQARGFLRCRHVREVEELLSRVS